MGSKPKSILHYSIEGRAIFRVRLKGVARYQIRGVNNSARTQKVLTYCPHPHQIKLEFPNFLILMFLNELNFILSVYTADFI